MQSRVPYCLGPERGGGVHVHEDLVRIGLQGGPTIRQGYTLFERSESKGQALALFERSESKGRPYYLARG